MTQVEAKKFESPPHRIALRAEEDDLFKEIFGGGKPDRDYVGVPQRELEDRWLRATAGLRFLEILDRRIQVLMGIKGN